MLDRKNSADVVAPAAPPAVATERDLRLDLFRGLALWLIFLDHIPSNAVSWVTIRNYGFSDATEIFVFISGFTAAFVYGRAMNDQGFVVASARVLKRSWQIYVAHVFLFAIYLAEIAYISQTFDNPLYTEEMGILDFLKHPDVTIMQALLLKFKPVNMDVLPLYIVLLACFSPALWLLLRAPNIALATSALLYALMWKFDINLPAYPSGTWAFNPFAWQLLFVFGGWCALGGAQKLAPWVHSPFVRRSRSAICCSVFTSRWVGTFRAWPIPCRASFPITSTRSTRPISMCCASHTSWPWRSSPFGSFRRAGKS